MTFKSHSVLTSFFGCIAAALLLINGCAHAATKTVVLKEQLNQKWTNELLSYPFEAAQGAAVAESLSVSGPDGAVPAQFADVELWSNTKFIKSARVLFVVPSLEPRATQNYTISYGTTAATQPASDLKVTPVEGGVEASTPHIAARLAVGAKSYDTAVAAQEVPGPLQSLRLADGAWGGGSTLYGELGVKSWSSQVLESGPVRAAVETRYVMADDSTATFTAQLVAGDDKVLWQMRSDSDRPSQGIDFHLGQLPNVKQIAVPKSTGQWGRSRSINVAPSAEPVAFLQADSSILNVFPESGAALVMAPEGGAQLRIASRDSGAWVDPVKPFTYGGQNNWNLDMIPLSWENWKRKRVPITYAADGSISMKVSFAAGRRLWSIGSGEGVVGERLNEVNELALDWLSDTQHPRLFMSKAELEEVWKRDADEIAKIKPRPLPGKGISGHAAEAFLMAGGTQEAAEWTKVIDQLRHQLGLLGDYDTMRYGIAAAGLYDAVMGTGYITPDEKSLFRAQMAYFAYKMADPTMWSIERGYHSGNPNMSISYTLTLGILAAAIPDHPMAKTWSDYATGWMDKWLTDEVGANGEWLPEGSHYSQVSVEPLITYAIAAKRAGFHDFLSDPRLMKLALYFAKQWTPADPQRKNNRVSPPYGRGTAGDVNGIWGVLARATAESDPEFSKTLQWAWQQAGYPTVVPDWRLGGFEQVYLNRNLPAQKPDWNSEIFPGIGAVLRSAVGNANEHYVNVLATTDSQRNLDIWTPEIGDIASWFAFGKPIVRQFSFTNGYNERHELLSSGVTLARNWGETGDSKTPFGYYTKPKLEGFSALPRADYIAATYSVIKPDDRDWFPNDLSTWPRVQAATTPTLSWTRQTMFMKDDSSTGPHYILLRDTTSGGQPTMWQFWTLSEKLGTADQAKDVTTFLTEKPGTTIQPASELPMSNRYTALGQFDVDLEYFIASPTSTPRSTLRYGGVLSNVPEYQDLLHLQMPGDGAYFVALFPRTRGTAAPTFSTLGDGKVIKVVGAFGTDYGFLSHTTGKATAESATFEGTAGSVQIRKEATVLTLNAPGTVSHQEYSLASPAAASLRIEPKAITVSVTGEAKSTQLKLSLPRNWKLAKSTPGMEFKRLGKGEYQLTVPAQVATLQLVPA